VVSRTYITFGNNGRGCVLLEGEINVSDKVTLRRVALVQSLGFNLLFVSKLLDEGFEVLFWLGGSRILDSRGGPCLHGRSFWHFLRRYRFRNGARKPVGILYDHR
jgi:hypothetical protein